MENDTVALRCTDEDGIIWEVIRMPDETWCWRMTDGSRFDTEEGCIKDAHENGMLCELKRSKE